MFWHLFKNRVKVLLHSKVMLFWTMLFPIVLTTFFYFAFSNLHETEILKTIPIAVVENSDLEKNIHFKETIASLSGKEGLLETKYVSTKKEAETLLSKNKIKGYIGSTSELYIVTKKNGIEATILKTMVDTYYSKISMLENISKETLYQTNMDSLQNTEETASYIKENNNENMDFTVIFFYTMIGMVCMYAGFFGISAVSETEANQSVRGARTSISPVHKGKVLLTFLLVGWMFQYIENLILLAYMVFILGVDFGTHIPFILLLMLIGSFAGLLLGTFIGAVSKKGENVKVPIFLTIDLLFSFLAGMMMWQMKYIIEESIPLLGKINPVTMITDALYSLYYYDTFTLYYEKLLGLAFFGVVLLIGSYFLIRRKKYDSI